MAANFWTSSHCERWLLSEEKVKQSNSKDIQHFKSRKNVWTLRLYFVEYLHKLGRRLKFRQHVISTAVVFFKRFYVKWSFCDFDPRLIAPTLLFIAAKVEECAVNVSAITTACEALGQPNLTDALPWVYSKGAVLEAEYYALQVLHFDLIVFHPYRPLTQYIADIGMQDALQTAWSIVNDSYRTDLCLTTPPYLIAVAAIYMTCVFLDKDCRQWLNVLQIDTKQVIGVSRVLLALYDESATHTDDKHVNETTALLSKLNEIFPPTSSSSSASSSSSSSALPVFPLSILPEQTVKDLLDMQAAQSSSTSSTSTTTSSTTSSSSAASSTSSASQAIETKTDRDSHSHPQNNSAHSKSTNNSSSSNTNRSSNSQQGSSNSNRNHSRHNESSIPAIR